MNEDEIIASLSDEEKIKLILSPYVTYNLTKLIYSIQNDDLKLSVIDKLDKYLRIDVIKSLSSDDLKLKCIENGKFSGYEKKEIINTIKSDDAIIKSLDLLDQDFEKRDVILIIQSDEKKIEAMKNNIKTPYYYNAILLSIKSEQVKIDNLKLITNTYDKKRMIETIDIDSDEKRIIIAKAVEDDEVAGALIKKIEDEEIKIKAIDIISDEYRRSFVIGTLKDDSVKMKMLENIEHEGNRARIIATLKSDAIKIEEIEKLEDFDSKCTVIRSLSNDSLKLNEMEKLDWINEERISFIIESFEDDRLKIEQLEKIKQEKIRVEIISTVKDDSLKLATLETVEVSEMSRARIIATMEDDKLKQKELTKTTSDFAKAHIIKSFEDESTIIEEVKKIRNDFAKVDIIISLRQKNIETGDLEQSLEDDFAKKMLISSTVINFESEKDKNPLNDRELLKEDLLKENRAYTEIGLDPNMTIGMEIESEGLMSKNLRILNKILEKKDGDKIKGWETKGDGSLDDGVEIVSPILMDNQKDVEDIYMACEMMHKCGQTVSENCGGHIHIGADYLTSKEAYVNLFEIWGNCEEVIYKIANEKGDIPRDGIQEFSPPISPKLNDAIENGTINLESEEELDKFIEVIQEVQEERYSGLNLLNINNGKNTIEFRIPNGTINGDTWIENARLFGRIIQISQKVAEVEKSTELEIEEQTLLQLRDRIKDENVSEQEKMETLLELLFSEEEREVYRDRYFTNTKILEQTSEDKNPFKKTKFKKVDFKKKHTKDEMKEVAINERLENVNEVTYETSNGVREENQIENANDRSMEE